MRYIIVFLTVFLFAVEPVSYIKPVKYNKQKAKLGKKLFFETKLSADKKVSCASCHSPSFKGADNKRFSIGVFGRIDTPMNSPTAYNAVFNCWQFWNGRAENLKEQACDAMMDSKEMGMTPEMVEEYINNSKYKPLFEEIYGKRKITADMVCDAIAEFEKALITPDSKFDRYLKGDKNALNKQEKRGYVLFKAYGCITCHNGVNFGGNSFQKIGIFIDDINISRGRDRYYVTHNPLDKYVYKVPTLRNIEYTAPYFHDGSVKSLKKAIILMGKYNLGVDIPLKDVEDIEMFLKTLTGKEPEILSER